MGIKKVGLIFIAVIIGLGSCGVSYACWNNTWWSHSWRNHRVQCDDCRVVFESPSSNDPGSSIDPDYDKHVAKTTVKIYKRKWYRCWGSQPRNKLIVTVYNAYPCYEPTIYYKVKVESQKYGAKLTGIRIDGDVVAAGEEVSLYDGELVVLVVTVNPPQEIQRCDSASGNIIIHVEQQALQCHTYKFTVTMDYECTTCSNPGENSGGNPSYGKDGDQQYDKGKFNRWFRRFNRGWWWNR